MALVGLGAIGLDAHLPAILRSARARLIAVVDSSDARRDLAPVDDRVLRLESLAEALAVPGVEVVILATPPWITPDLAVQAARAGHFVLAEKPVAVSTAAASVYDALSDEERRRIQVGLTYRNDPAIEHLRGVISRGELGFPLLVRAHIYDERFDRTDERHTALIESTLEYGSPVIHEGAHVLDWLAHLLGAQPRLADAWAIGTRAGLAEPNLTGARLDYPDGSQALLEFGWFTEALPRCELTFLGDKGIAVLQGQSFALEITTADGTESIGFPGERGERSFDLQLERVIDLASGRTGSGSPSLDDGRAALELAERIAALAASTESRGATT